MCYGSKEIDDSTTIIADNDGDSNGTRSNSQAVLLQTEIRIFRSSTAVVVKSFVIAVYIVVQ